MKSMKLVVGILFLGTGIGLSWTPAHAQDTDVISKDAMTASNYCHMKFPAMREDTLDQAVPALDSNDVIDFYGSCATDPRGKEEIQTQRIEAQHRFALDYEE